ncbi:hypothetical protein G7007_06975 [Pseudomonas entomophila]|uniref:hypothetical protein n=1 Tax=Pseudomonas entomophila TaxID=312306 RepID=UPI0015E2DD44|nr:hypothetical protein [Pseudomonas entomophila]MBA1192603.1 hypothetical protein [Pseudomonas entomophila]
MDQVDPLIAERIREWQARRLAIKDQMQASPERTLELSWVLDEMDEEHERILHAAQGSTPTADVPDPVEPAQASPPLSKPAPGQGRHRLDLRLDVSAANVDDLRALIQTALHELDGKLGGATGHSLTGRMGGTLGDYRFELQRKGLSDE